MARQKSAFRKRLNIRWIRHAAFSALARTVPFAGRAFNVPPRAVRALDIATSVLEDVYAPVDFVVAEDLRRQVLEPAAAFDTGEPGSLGTTRVMLWRQAAILEGCDIAGHTLSILRATDGALVNLKADAPNWNYGKPARLRARQAAEGLHAVLQGVSSNYHFFGNEILPLMDWLERLHPPGQLLTLVTPAQMPAFARDTLNALCARYPQLRLLPLNPDEKLTGARILWLYSLHSNYEWMPVCRRQADALSSILAPDALADAAPLLFVSRRDARIRQLTNEAELEAQLAARGFTTFVPGRAPLAEQIARFRAADVIVAVHGAALTNLLFCRPGTKVIEIFPANFVKSTYLWLAGQLGLHYHAVIAGEGDYLQNFGVDSAALATLMALADEASAVHGRSA